MEGDSAVINKAYHKAVPDNVDLTTGGKPLVITFDPNFNSLTKQNEN